jgi:hypothetical protein
MISECISFVFMFDTRFLGFTHSGQSDLQHAFRVDGFNLDKARAAYLT